MIPSINTMMSGKILAGADPLITIRYQIVVMFMLVGSTAIRTITVMQHHPPPLLRQKRRVSGDGGMKARGLPDHTVLPR